MTIIFASRGWDILLYASKYENTRARRCTPHLSAGLLLSRVPIHTHDPARESDGGSAKE